MRTHNERLTAANAERIVAGYDIVADGSDNFATRYLLNDTCYRLKKPLVSAAILRFDGQISTYKAWQGAGHPCLRCIFPEAPSEDAVPSCAQAGVLGALAGTLGALQATEVVKEILGIGRSLSGRLLTYDALDGLVRRDGDRQAARLPDLWHAMKTPEGGVSVIVRVRRLRERALCAGAGERRARRQQAGRPVLHHGRHPRPDGPAAARSTTGRAMPLTAQRGVGDFETLLQACVELGARFIVCEMGLRVARHRPRAAARRRSLHVAGIVTLLEETKPGMHLVSL